MSDERAESTEPGCLNCGHHFGAAEIAAMEGCDDADDLCVIECSACGRYNVVRTRQQRGFDAQPEIVVLRASREKPGTAGVFDETVEPGTDVHPVTRGESN